MLCGACGAGIGGYPCKECGFEGSYSNLFFSTQHQDYIPSRMFYEESQGYQLVR